MSPSTADPATEIRLKALSVGLSEGAICVLHQDFDHRFDMVENLPSIWPSQTLIGLVEADVLPAEISSGFATAHDLCRASAQKQTIEFEMGEGLRRRYFEARLLADGAGVTIAIIDRTDVRAHDLALASLLREVSHRSKNLLAIVQSVAMQTAHHSGDIYDFLNKFRGRLHALSSTQDLVTESDWRGTYLQSLIAAQMARVGAGTLANIAVTGANPLLGPNASLHVGLAVHELGANAVVHGALAEGRSGRVDVKASIMEHDSGPAHLVIEWRESGIDPYSVRHEPRFGTLVLERIVPLSVGGTAELEIEPSSLTYRLVIPADQFDA